MACSTQIWWIHSTWIANRHCVVLCLKRELIADLNINLSIQQYDLTNYIHINLIHSLVTTYFWFIFVKLPYNHSTYWPFSFKESKIKLRLPKIRRPLICFSSFFLHFWIFDRPRTYILSLNHLKYQSLCQ